MRKIGFLVNPIAGMGGAVGLKGTDGAVEQARERGAVPHAADRGRATLALLASEPDLFFLTCSGAMGGEVLDSVGIKNYEIVYRIDGESSAEDTREAAHRFREAGVDLILFCGGDGTARDVVSVVGRDVPVLGIPAGVKMYSAVFAIDPESAAGLVSGFDARSVRDAEVMDVDEEAYRANQLRTTLYALARVPVREGLTQLSKQVFEEADEDRAKQEIARFLHEIQVPGALYIIGAGTTTEAIAHECGVEKTLLGVDVIRDRELVAKDADEKTLLVLTENERDVWIIISPIGAQGFIFGRGNQQISAAVIRRAGINHVIVTGTPQKLRHTPELYIDTGDPALDAGFGKSVPVISGYKIAQRKRVHVR